MPVQIPAGYMLLARLESPDAVKALEEWNLSTQDVQNLCGVATPQAVYAWTTRGRGGFTLPTRRFGITRGGVHAFRLQDVEVFASHFGWVVRYDLLPDWMQRRYRVGRYEGLPSEEPPTINEEAATP